jgi:hypothetical protein
MTSVPPFEPTTGHLPPGRFRTTFDDARALLVDDPRLAGSSTRRTLWTGLERYLARFESLREEYAAALTPDPVVHYVWLGGSFASRELDPKNIDLTVCLDVENRARMRGKPGSRWLVDAFARDKVKAEFGLSPLLLPYLRVPSVFRLDRLDQLQLGYLQSRGGWDDWWQRCRTAGADSSPPSEATAEARRGYLEVVL